jgi:hypothetical protein
MFRSPPPVNDNIQTRGLLYAGIPEYLPHIPAARYLILKYIGEYWRHDCDDIDFVHQEMTLCGYMLMPTENLTARKLKIKWVARELGVNPMVLYNDPHLPF